jgi:hypothetical protein
MSQAQMLATQNAGITGATQATNAAAATAFPTATTLPAAANAATTGLQLTAPAAGSKGLLASAMASPYTMPAAIMSGTQLVGGAMQGYGAQKQQDQQIQLAADERKRYDTNVGTRLYPTARA